MGVHDYICIGVKYIIIHMYTCIAVRVWIAILFIVYSRIYSL